MKIDSVAPSKHIKDRYIVTFEDGSILKTTINEIADYSLYKGRELTDSEYSRLRGDADSSNAYALALRIIGARMMSRKRMTEKLIEKGVSPEIAEDTADRLEKIGALNDREYASLIVSHYSGEGYGAAKIRDELYRRGIPSAMWDEALAGMPDMSEAAYEFISGRLRGNIPDRDERRKISNAAMRRGFSWEEIRSALSRYESEVWE